MSGLLDNKSRVIDAILTYEGRRQMAESTFNIKYATFSDTHVFYQADSTEGHYDPTKRIYLEVFNSPQDQVVFEADDSGNLVPFRQHSSINPSSNMGSDSGSASWYSFVNGKIKSRIQLLSTSSAFASEFKDIALSGSAFASQLEGILSSSIDNFKKIRIVGSIDPIFEDKDFALNTNEISFSIPVDSNTLQMVPPTSANTIDSLFSDEKLRNVDNFKYLPPIKKTNIAVDKTDIEALRTENLLLGDYTPWGPIEKLSFADIQAELKNYENFSKTIFFDPTSRDNEIIAQFFEITNEEARKLDVIEYGRVNNNSQNPSAVTNHVFFVGKVIVDDNGSTCFVHLFTLVFSPDEES